MTAEIINLNKVRKARERADREREAHENRLKYGQSKPERNLADAQHRKTQSDLEGARREGKGGVSDADDIDPSNAS
jgi:benzoyl-CoA reductase/2-hydroxyglutaryl-CoA dehydratase subunit BcrC/BadD/HgdB